MIKCALPIALGVCISLVFYLFRGSWSAKSLQSVYSPWRGQQTAGAARFSLQGRLHRTTEQLGSKKGKGRGE